MRRLPHTPRTIGLAAVLAAFACGFAPGTAGAQTFCYDVTLNASPLVSSDAGPFTLDFQLTSGISPDANRTQAVLSDFSFGGGAPSGSPTLVGGASGDLSSTVLLRTSSFLNDFQQGFTPVGVLSFDLCLVTDPASPPRDPADGFSFAILDSLGVEIPTLGFFDIFSDVLISVDLTGLGTPEVLTYATDDSQPPAAGTTPITMDAPTVTIEETGNVPEPGSLAMLGGMAAFAGLFAIRRRNRLKK